MEDERVIFYQFVLAAIAEFDWESAGEMRKFAEDALRIVRGTPSTSTAATAILTSGEIKGLAEATQRQLMIERVKRAIPPHS